MKYRMVCTLKRSRKQIIGETRSNVFAAIADTNCMMGASKVVTIEACTEPEDNLPVENIGKFFLYQIIK